MKSKILIVDDSSLDLEIISDYLHSLDCILVRASDGYEAMLVSEREGPDLVLLDVLLPGPDGIQVLREIKSTAKDEYLPVLLMSAVTSADYRRAGMEAGADGFLQKPLNPLELVPTVEHFLELRARFGEVARQREKLRMAQDARQMLTNLLVHDLRNPITVIQSNLHFLLCEMEEKADDEWVAAATESRAATSKLLRMVNNIVGAAKIEEGTQELCLAELELEAAFEVIVERVSGALAGKTIRQESSPDLSIWADPSLLNRALENIIETVGSFAQSDAELVLRGARTDDDRVRIEVFAPSAAVPQELKQYLFERFHQVSVHVSPSTRHAALALYYCRLVAAAHKGDISLPSRDDGLSIALTLPLKAPSAVAGQETDS